MKTIFVVDDDPVYQRFMQSHLNQLGYQVKSFFTGEDCMENLYQKPFAVILDHYLANGESGMQIMQRIKSVENRTPVIYLSGQDDVSTAVEAMRIGAFEYIEKNGAAFVRLRTAIERLEKVQLRKGNIFMRLFGS